MKSQIQNILVDHYLEDAVFGELRLVCVLPDAAWVLGAHQDAVAGVEARPQLVTDQTAHTPPVFAHLRLAVVNCLHCGVNLEDYVSIKSYFYQLEHGIPYRTWITIMDSLPQSCPSPVDPCRSRKS